MKLGVPNLVYDGLDLSGLRYVRGQFDESNRHEAVKVVKREADIKSRAGKVKADDFDPTILPAAGSKANTDGQSEKRPFTIKATRKRKSGGAS